MDMMGLFKPGWQTSSPAGLHHTSHALILPHFDYRSPVWDCMSGYLSDKLQKIQKKNYKKYSCCDRL